MSSLPSPPVTPPKPLPIGRLLVGAFLVLLGIGWLLDAVDVLSVDWDVVLPVGLILVGIALVFSAWRGEGRGGLIALGVVLTVLLTVGTVVHIPLGAGIGDRTERPATLGAVPERYELSIGKLTVDLTRLPSGATMVPTTIRARVGIGQLIVLLPEGVTPPVKARVGVGEAVAGDRRNGGIGVQLDREGSDAAPFRLDLSVGLGQIEVRYG